MLSVLLGTAGLLKVLDPRPFGWALFRVLPPSWTGWRYIRPAHAGLAVGTAEVVVGAAVLVAPRGWTWLPLLPMTALYVSFVGVVRRAVRKGHSCACWGSFSDGIAAGAELGRSAALAALAVAAALTRTVVSPAGSLPGTLARASVCVAFVVVCSRVGRRLRPQASSRAASSPLLRSGAGLRREVAILGGLVGHNLADREPRIVSMALPISAARQEVRR